MQHGISSLICYIIGLHAVLLIQSNSHETFHSGLAMALDDTTTDISALAAAPVVVERVIESFSIQESEVFENQIFNKKKHKEIPKDDPMDRFTTVVDVLSHNVIFSKFLLHLQHYGSIDYLNGLDNFTILAPVNSAFYLSDEEVLGSNFNIENYLIHDKVVNLQKEFQNKTHEEKGLKIINQGTHYPLVWEKKNSNDFFVYQHLETKSGTTTTTTTNNNDISVFGNNSSIHSNTARILTDSIFKPTLQNCTIIGIESLLPLPHHNIHDFFNKSMFDLEFSSQFFQNTKYLSWKEQLINNTVMVPTDKLMQSKFNSIELDYLSLDYEKINLNDEDYNTEKMHKKNKKHPSKTKNPYQTLVQDQISFIENFIFKGYIGGLQQADTVRNLKGVTANFSSVNNGLHIGLNDSISVSKPSILDYTHGDSDPDKKYGYGVAHVFQNMELPELRSMVHFNAQKYLLGLQAFDFVDELFFRKLDYLITNTDRKLTLFVSLHNSETYTTSKSTVFHSSSGYSTNILIYHFIEEELDLADCFKSFTHASKNSHLRESRLFESMYCARNHPMGGACQKLKLIKKFDGVDDADNYSFYVNHENTKVLNNEPYKVGNTSIYVVSEQLSLPLSLTQSVGSFLHCSTSLMFLEQLNLLDLKRNDHGYTVLLPCFDSWNDLQLNFDFIKNNVTALNLIMKNLIWENLMYSDIAGNSEFETYTLNGDKIDVAVENNKEDQKNGQVMLNVSSIQDSLVLIEKNKDIIFQQGVIHPIETVPYPESLDITLIDLIKTSGSGNFLLFMQEIPSLYKLLEQNLPYSILVPTPSSLLLDGDINFNATRLEDILRLHIVSENSTSALLNCEGDIYTEFDEPLSCRKADSDNYFLQVKNGLDKEVRILKKGCSTENPNSCVFIIDKPIALKWLTKENYYLHLPYVSFAMGIVIGVVGFTIFSLFVMYLLSRKQYDLQAEDDYDEEQRSDGDYYHYSEGDSNSRRSQRQSSIRSNMSSHSDVSGRTPLLSGANGQGTRNTSVTSVGYQSILSNDGSNDRRQGSSSRNVVNPGAFESQYSENSKSRPIIMQSKKSTI